MVGKGGLLQLEQHVAMEIVMSSLLIALRDSTACIRNYRQVARLSMSPNGN